MENQITYRNLNREELDRKLFSHFERRQEVTKCWRKVEGEWVIQDNPFIDEWSEEDYGYLVKCLGNTIDTGGLVQGAFYQEKLKGFVSLESELIGGNREYVDLTSIHVSEDMRGSGIGRNLFASAVSWGKEQGASKLYISAHSAIETQAFYKSMGCVEAKEYCAAHVEAEPCDCQLEYHICKSKNNEIGKVLVRIMKKMELLPKGVNYYKANLHCHTTISDGCLTPEEMKKCYQEKGYQVVAFTDHTVYRNHEYLNDNNFIAIAAMETDINEYSDFEFDFSRLKTWHMNWYDMNPSERKEEKAALTNMERRYHDRDYINEYAEKMKGLGFLGCYNHPYWSLQNYDDYKNLKGLWAMEIYNHGCEVEGLYGYHPQAYDEMLRTGQRLFAVSTDDNHNRLGFDDGLCDSFGGYVMIGAKEFTYAGIMEALKKGDFYSVTVPDGRSEGPKIHQMTVEENKLFVTCSPVDKIFLKMEGRDCGRAAAKPGETITEAVFPLTGKEGFIRLSILDAQGRRADSNAYFMDRILERV